MTAIEWGGKPAAGRIDPHHLAWGVLLLCFALFCVLLASFLLTAEHFLFQSALPMDVVLNVGRGTVSISDLANPVEQVGINGAAVPDGVIIRTDPQSQGTILFMDEEAGEQRMMASLTLQRDSRVTLLSAQRPRFPWSRRGHEIALQDVIGEMNLTITEHAGPGMRVFGKTPGRAWLEMRGTGTYTIEGASEELRLFNHSGSVRLESADGRQNRVIPVGGQGAVLYDEPRVDLRPGYSNLLQDEDFSQLSFGADATRGNAWTCDQGPTDGPPGSVEFIAMAGLQPLRLWRDDGVTTHGESFCVQHFGQSGLHLGELDLEYLSLRVSFYIEHASLGSCGTEGSECPVMLMIDYLDQEYIGSQGDQQTGENGVRAVPPGGDAIKWRHGFYIRTREEWPRRCDTCIQDHQLVHGNSWYVYESPNLLTMFSPKPPPRVIVGVQVYASGHEYDVRIRDLALLAMRRDLRNP